MAAPGYLKDTTTWEHRGRRRSVSKLEGKVTRVPFGHGGPSTGGLRKTGKDAYPSVSNCRARAVFGHKRPTPGKDLQKSTHNPIQRTPRTNHWTTPMSDAGDAEGDSILRQELLAGLIEQRPAQSRHRNCRRQRDFKTEPNGSTLREGTDETKERTITRGENTVTQDLPAPA